jgi:hypothetical protein
MTGASTNTHNTVHTPYFNSVHGFYSRAHRAGALKGFVISAIATHKLQQGVLAFVLDDTIGLVQEYNGLRNGWIRPDSSG